MAQVLVIGGSGFLGRAIVDQLVQRHQSVRVFDRVAASDPRLESIVGDIVDFDVVDRACANVDTVYHTAALVDWRPGQSQRLYDVNVRGTLNVIRACQLQGVRRLIYTSSVDVVFDGHPIVDGDERLPYPAKHLDDYGRTKTIAEQAVIAANGQGRVATCSLRTAGIYGPHDRHRLPGVLQSARRGQLMRIGDGHARFNHVYVTNAAYAHVLAAQALSLDSPVAGQCYFITDYAATNFFEFMRPFLAALGYSWPTKSMPYAVAYALASVTEAAARLGIGQPSASALTRYVVASTGRDFNFTHAKATRDFGYEPSVPLEQAIAETIEWLKANQHTFDA